MSKSFVSQWGPVLDLCQATAGRDKIVASCLYGPQVSGYAAERNGVNVLLVLRDYRLILKTFQKSLNNRKIFIMTVSQGAFQKDVEKGWLGEFVADKLIAPYRPLINGRYLWDQEVALKKRIVWELLEGLVSEFPELSRELVIKPEYFLYETLSRRARLFPQITYQFLNMLRRDLKTRNVEVMMHGYLEAIKMLAQEDWITFSSSEVKVTPKLIKKVRTRKIRVPVLLKSVQRAALLHILNAFPEMMNTFVHDEELYLGRPSEIVGGENLTVQLEDPKNWLLMPTPFGLVPMSDKTTIEEFVKKAIRDSDVFDVQTRRIGGVLNSVYSLEFKRDHEEQKVVVKKFKDWVGFKWFPLALWALGTKSFAVSGKSRLEREYALNQFLHNKGLTVPKILYISPKESLIFEEFVKGENMATIVRRIIMLARQKRKIEKELALIKEAGKKIAVAHQLGVALGDCKPENVIVTEVGKPCFVDLEQASRDGNQAWDVAEFLYYSGHYVSPFSSTDTAELVAEAFIEGYLEAGGDRETVKKAASPRYTKVFSIFTPPQVILAISNVCRKTLQTAEKQQTASSNQACEETD